MDKRKIGEVVDAILRELADRNKLDYETLLLGDDFGDIAEVLMKCVTDRLLTTDPSNFVLRIIGDNVNDFKFNDVYKQGGKVICEADWSDLK